MLRAATWTVGLFAMGGGVVHFFPGPFTEPVVLMVLGAALFLVSGRSRTAPRSVDANASPTSVVAPASRSGR